MKNQRKKIIIAISGGVDSAVAAFLLKKQGYEPIGIFMRIQDDYQCSEAAARRVCRFLGIKFFPVNLRRQFKRQVIDYFLDAYSKGLTPNPCVNCNKFIKFGELVGRANALGVNLVATGHYVKKQKNNFENSFKLLRGKDEKKDQSYFLYTLKQSQLKSIIFPLGNFTKEEIKEVAKKQNLPCEQKESQDVCFLQNQGRIIDHNEFLKIHLKLKKGLIKDMNGCILGEHQGLPLYTIGQRRGVEIGGTGPYYVVCFDYQKNILYVSNERDYKDLYKKDLIAREINWIDKKKPEMPLKCKAVIRYRHKEVQCVVSKKDAGKLKVTFRSSQRAVTPGQSVVFYLKNEVLGGGIIC